MAQGKDGVRLVKHMEQLDEVLDTTGSGYNMITNALNAAQSDEEFAHMSDKVHEMYPGSLEASLVKSGRCSKEGKYISAGCQTDRDWAKEKDGVQLRDMPAFRSHTLANHGCLCGSKGGQRPQNSPPPLGCGTVSKQVLPATQMLAARLLASRLRLFIFRRLRSPHHLVVCSVIKELLATVVRTDPLVGAHT